MEPYDIGYAIGYGLGFVLAPFIGLDAQRYAQRYQVKGPANTPPVAWFLGAMVLWIIVVPVYLHFRSKTPLAPGDPHFATDQRVSRPCPACQAFMGRADSICQHCGTRSRPWVFHGGVWWWQDEAGRWFYLVETTGNWIPGS